jgi:hypothetical protein
MKHSPEPRCRSRFGAEVGGAEAPATNAHVVAGGDTFFHHNLYISSHYPFAHRTGPCLVLVCVSNCVTIFIAKFQVAIKT